MERVSEGAAMERVSEDGRFTMNDLDDEVEVELDRSQLEKLAAEIEEKNERSADYTVYTGSAGAALALLRYGEATENVKWLKKALELAEDAEKKMIDDKDVNVTFLCGQPGTMAVLAACRAARNKNKSAKQSATGVLAVAPWAVDADGECLELFKGKCGYLQALNFVKARVKLDAVEETAALTKQLHHRLVIRKEDVQYHGKTYLGAAHGWAGIVQCVVRYPKLQEAARNLSHKAASFQFASKNVPASVKGPRPSKKDLLVHWCHGAPGWVEPRLALGDLDGALEAAEVTWERGLLRTKGPGLCHGVPGNGTVFLALYRATKDSKHLRRALHFAKFALDHLATLKPLADHPYSLFEGAAGALCFAADCIDAQKGNAIPTPAPFFFLPTVIDDDEEEKPPEKENVPVEKETTTIPGVRRIDIGCPMAEVVQGDDVKWTVTPMDDVPLTKPPPFTPESEFFPAHEAETYPVVSPPPPPTPAEEE